MTGKQILASNLKRIVKDLGLSEVEFSRKLGFGEKTINNYVNAVERERTVSLDHVDEIARFLGCDTWKLFIPDLTLGQLKATDIDKLLFNYIETNPDGQSHIMRVAEREATYHK